MNYKLKLSVSRAYSEVPQYNPLRWKIMSKQDDTFVDQTGWIKCKDFFNDLVAKEYGVEFPIYGFNNADIKKDAEGYYFLLNFIENKERFLANIKVVNKRLKEDTGVVLSTFDVDEPEQVVLLLPNELWANTWMVSLVTYLIRCSNYEYAFKDWNDIWSSKSPCKTMESALNHTAQDIAAKIGFKVPEKYKDFWWFNNDRYNSKTYKVTSYDGHWIHNCGCSTWSLGMKGV